ncbi:hypothetical protein THRCLA_22271 [Thraustotheca clavata]|uniref:N-acetyltransferase domain-containing protein n=1 Tax=Thraustotheca clavata TaxID=74557 RepID=A0A1V9Z7F9_9STRA|nr:hypothetical protein THRCLA_22271 [Thraustotheca clavata]
MEQQDDDKHGLKEWKRRLNECNGCIFYVVDANDQIVGFVFVHDHATMVKTTHIWIAGTLPSARRKGVMKSLFEHCHSVYANQDRITVNTFPTRFPNMPFFLASMNYKLTSMQADKHLYHKQL